MSFKCQYSGLDVDQRVFLPGKRSKIGTFADVNCAMAWLSTEKPRNWKKKWMAVTELLKTECGFTATVFLPGAREWSLTDPRRIAVAPQSMVQSAAEYAEEQRRAGQRRSRLPCLPPITGKKRAREGEGGGGGDDERPPFLSPMPSRRSSAAAANDEEREGRVASNAISVASGETRESERAPRKRFKVTVADDDAPTKRYTFFTDHWRGDIARRYPLSHAIPAYFERDGTFTLHPLLACDGKTLQATPCRITVELSTPVHENKD